MMWCNIFDSWNSLPNKVETITTGVVDFYSVNSRRMCFPSLRISLQKLSPSIGYNGTKVLINSHWIRFHTIWQSILVWNLRKTINIFLEIVAFQNSNYANVNWIIEPRTYKLYQPQYFLTIFQSLLGLRTSRFCSALHILVFQNFLNCNTYIYSIFMNIGPKYKLVYLIQIQANHINKTSENICHNCDVNTYV